MSNPFENPDGEYFTLVNDEGQRSLWPKGIDVPEGWQIEQGPSPRLACLEHIERVWTDMRPRSLQAKMKA